MISNIVYIKCVLYLYYHEVKESYEESSQLGTVHFIVLETLVSRLEFSLERAFHLRLVMHQKWSDLPFGDKVWLETISGFGSEFFSVNCAYVVISHIGSGMVFFFKYMGQKPLLLKWGCLFSSAL